MTQASIAVRPSALGMLVVMVLKMFTRTRKTVMRRVILCRMDWIILNRILFQDLPARDNIRGDEKANPTDDDKHSRGKVAGDDVVGYLPP